MKFRIAASTVLNVSILAAALGVLAKAPDSPAALPQRLSETGLSDAGTRRFSPQYPLWSDGARKSRWVWLPPGATIDASRVDAWSFPVGTRFWKEFEFAGRKVETRLLWKSSESAWTFGSYLWNEDQTDAVLAPEEGLAAVAEVAPGRFHSIPSVADCRACHDSARTEILGFTPLQLSTDRDPQAPHAEMLASDMVTVRTLVDEGLLAPSHPELVSTPPRIEAPDTGSRAALGYLLANCGSCHNADSSLASLGLLLKSPDTTRPHSTDIVRSLLRRTAKWQIPGIGEEASRFVTPGEPDLSAIVIRMRSRRPSTQMPPLGSVIPDRMGIEAVTAWISGMSRVTHAGR